MTQNTSPFPTHKQWRTQPRHLNCHTLKGLLEYLAQDGVGLGLRGIIFDLDGVIVETEHLHYQAYKEVLIAHGIELSIESYQRFFQSRGRKTALKALLPHLSEDDHTQIGQEKDALFMNLIPQQKDICFPDALELLDILKDIGLITAIGTAASNGRRLLGALDLERRFNAIVTAADVSRNKPAPDIYIKCRELLQLPAESLLVIEDSDAGVQAALAAGLWVVQVHRQPML